MDVPRFYTWNSVERSWQRRKRGTKVRNWNRVKEVFTIGRLYTVHITNFECFCLRVLLLNKIGPTGFDDLKIVNGIRHETYSQACEAMGLLENDDHWKYTLDEAANTQSPNKLRQLFAIMLTFCELKNPKHLWESYKQHMSEDILYNNRRRAMDHTIDLSERVI